MSWGGDGRVFAVHGHSAGDKTGRFIVEGRFIAGFADLLEKTISGRVVDEHSVAFGGSTRFIAS